MNWRVRIFLIDVFGNDLFKKTGKEEKIPGMPKHAIYLPSYWHIGIPGIFSSLPVFLK